MTAEAFVIRELTGPKREIQLFDRALPFPKLNATRMQRHVKKTYAGSRIATIQVMGPDVDDWTINGVWHTRYIAGTPSVKLVGFDDLGEGGGKITAEDLCIAFSRLISTGGQTVEVRWGPEIRIGIMSKFTPSYERVEDIEWKAEFVWTTDDSAARPTRAGVPIDPYSDMSSSLDALDDAMSTMPTQVMPAPKGAILSALDSVRQLGSDLLDVYTAVQRGSALVRSAIAKSEALIDAAEVLRTGLLSDQPYYVLVPFDDLRIVWQVEIWRREVTASSRKVQASSRRLTASMIDAQQPGVIAVVNTTERTSLRMLAIRYYNDGDSWTVIADANKLTSSYAPAGTRVVVPRPAIASSTAT